MRNWEWRNSVWRKFGTNSLKPLKILEQNCQIAAQQAKTVNGSCYFLWAFGWLLPFKRGLLAFAAISWRLVAIPGGFWLQPLSL